MLLTCLYYFLCVCDVIGFAVWASALINNVGRLRAIALLGIRFISWIYSVFLHKARVILQCPLKRKEHLFNRAVSFKCCRNTCDDRRVLSHVVGQGVLHVLCQNLKFEF